MGSGSISLFCSKCFSPFPHGTCTLSVSKEYLALPDGPGEFGQDSSCPDLLRIPLCLTRLRVRGCHPLRRRFPTPSASRALAILAVLLPRRCRNNGGLGCSPFARRYSGNRESRLFSSPAGTKMFQFPAFACLAACRAFNAAGSPIRTPADQRSFAPTRGFSQLVASFIASWSLGIHHTPFIICSIRDFLIPKINIISVLLDFILPSFQHVKELISCHHWRVTWRIRESNP